MEISKVLDTPDKRLRRENAWHGIVIHHTGLPSSVPKDLSAWQRFQNNIASWLTAKDDVYASAHYQIGYDGEVIQLCDPDKYEAFHAGLSSAWNAKKRAIVSDWNRWAIGIELLGDGTIYNYSNSQYESLVDLCKMLIKKYPTIHTRCIYGHEEIAPGRKDDPGPLFDWNRFFKGLLN